MIMDRVVARIGADGFKHACIVVSDRRYVDLHGPALFRVTGAQEGKHKCLVRVGRFRIHLAAGKDLFECFARFLFPVWSGLKRQVFQAVIRSLAAVFVEKLNPVFQGIQEI
jgi:hypothetical protein